MPGRALVRSGTLGGCGVRGSVPRAGYHAGRVGRIGATGLLGRGGLIKGPVVVEPLRPAQGEVVVHVDVVLHPGDDAVDVGGRDTHV